MHFMYLANKVRDFRQFRTRKALRSRKREIDLGKDLIEKLSADDFKPEKYQDEYRERFLALVEQKTNGKEITIQRPAPERRGKVVDIFAALKRSLEQAAPQKQPVTRQRAAKSARKRRKA